MANLCNNYLRVKGQPDVARPFLEKLKQGGFGAFVPEPPPPVPDDTKGWWSVDWRNKNWGDKFDVHDYDCEFDVPEGKVRFVTAWSPQIQWLTQAAGQYPDLQFEMHYEECMNRVWGWVTISNGVVTCASQDTLAGYLGCQSDEEEGDSDAYQIVDQGPCNWYLSQTGSADSK